MPKSKKTNTNPTEGEKQKADIERDGLNLKQRKFIDYYMQSGNATEAYEKAYECSHATADTNGARLLGKTRIQEEIRYRLDMDRATDGWAYSKSMQYADMGLDNPKCAMAGIKGVEMIAKMRGLLVDTKRIAFTGDNPAVFPALVKDTTKKEMDEKVARGERISE